MTGWVDLIARARGLETHLLGLHELGAMVRAPDLAALGEALRRHGFPVDEGAPAPAALELAIRRRAAREMRVLVRWCGPRTDLLRVIFEDEERRSLRALLRGAVEGASEEARVSGLVPTPALPERALSELARQKTPAAVATTLTAWGNPYGTPLREKAAGLHPDLLGLEMVVNRTYVERALAGAQRAGGSELAGYVRELIDLENVGTAVALVAAKDLVPKTLFLHGGARVSIDRFERAIASRDGPAAAASLAPAFGATRLARVLADAARGTGTLDERLLHARLAALRRQARHHPLGLAPVLEYALHLRAESVDLSRTVWGLALGAPAPALLDALISAV